MLLPYFDTFYLLLIFYILIPNFCHYLSHSCYTPFQETLIFIDGASAAQVQFAHETHDKNKVAKIILVNGRPGIKQHEGKEHYYYFDQFGGYSSRFGITRVPSLVYQIGVEKVLTIQEVKVK